MQASYNFNLIYMYDIHIHILHTCCKFHVIHDWEENYLVWPLKTFQDHRRR